MKTIVNIMTLILRGVQSCSPHLAH